MTSTDAPTRSETRSRRLGRATAYGVFAGIQGVTAVGGGALSGWLYERSLTALTVVVAATQLVALLLLMHTLRGLPDRRRTATT